jgi:hypothetical protein
MQLHSANDGIQCNGCLALMSLVRGEGDVCQTNQWAIAKAGSVEVVAAAMRCFRSSAMVQLSALLAMIPLALENAMMQAHLTQECLPDVLAALDNHPDEADIQTKGLVLLGVLIQVCGVCVCGGGHFQAFLLACWYCGCGGVAGWCA